MAELPSRFLVHRASIRNITGHDAYGEELADEFTLPCFIRHRRKLLGTGDTGEQIVSEAIVRAPLRFADRVKPEALIRLNTDIMAEPPEATVIAVSVETDGDFGAWQHLKLEVA